MTPTAKPSPDMVERAKLTGCEYTNTLIAFALTERALARKEALEEAAEAIRGLASEYVSLSYAQVESMTAARAIAAIRSLIDQPGGGTDASVEIAHDGFCGDVIGHYVTREGKRGVVVQQHGTRVVHVYGEKWIKPTPTSPHPNP